MICFFGQFVLGYRTFGAGCFCNVVMQQFGMAKKLFLLQIKSLFCMIAINHTILHCDKTPEKMPAIKQRESGRAQIIGTAVFQFQSLSSWDMTLQN